MVLRHRLYANANRVCFRSRCSPYYSPSIRFRLVSILEKYIFDSLIDINFLLANPC